MSSRQPATGAGRRLLAVFPMDLAEPDFDMLGAVLAIEAEAAAREPEAVREALEGLLDAFEKTRAAANDAVVVYGSAAAAQAAQRLPSMEEALGELHIAEDQARAALESAKP